MSKTIIADRDALDKVLKGLLMGLIEPGEDRKQFYLEKALVGLTGLEWTAGAKKEFKWREGRI